MTEIIYFHEKSMTGYSMLAIKIEEIQKEGLEIISVIPTKYMIGKEFFDPSSSRYVINTAVITDALILIKKP